MQYDFVLRGFCKKCEESHRFREDNEYGLCDEGYSCQPIWFLSARQMQIVFGSDEFEKWAGQENYFELCNNAFTLIVKILEENPFLVAKILKEAGEKKEETYVDGTRIKSYNEQVSSAPKIVIDRAVNITKNPDALFDVALSDEEWKKKYPSTPKEKNSKEENK